MKRLREMRVMRGVTQFQLKLSTAIHQGRISLIEKDLVQPPEDNYVNTIPRHVAIMRIVVSLFLLIIGVFILTAPNMLIHTELGEGIQKVAIGWIGAVIGYWLA